MLLVHTHATAFLIWTASLLKTMPILSLCWEITWTLARVARIPRVLHCNRLFMASIELGIAKCAEQLPAYIFRATGVSRKRVVNAGRACRGASVRRKVCWNLSLAVWVFSCFGCLQEVGSKSGRWKTVSITFMLFSFTLNFIEDSK